MWIGAPLLFGCCGLTVLSAIISPPTPTAMPAAAVVVEETTEPIETATHEPTVTKKTTATPQPTRRPTNTPRPTDTTRPTATPPPTATPSLVAAMEEISFVPLTAENTVYIQVLFHETTVFEVTETRVRDMILDGTVTPEEAVLMTPLVTQALDTLREIDALDAPPDLQSVHRFAGSSLSPCFDLLEPINEMLSGGSGGNLVYSTAPCYGSLAEVLEVVRVYQVRNPDMVLESATAPTVAPTATPTRPITTVAPLPTATPTAVRVATIALPTATPLPPPPTAAPTSPPVGNCDPSYPDVCIAPPPPDLNCSDVPYGNFTVLPPDPHNFDGDGNGRGCENN